MSSQIFQKLGWAKTIGDHVKVHAIPLIIGSIAGLLVFEIADNEKMSQIAAFFANQTILDSMCQAYQICGLDVGMGATMIASVLAGVLFAYVSEKLYLAEAPKYTSIKEANQKAEKVISVVEQLTGTDIPTVKDE